MCTSSIEVAGVEGLERGQGVEEVEGLKGVAGVEETMLPVTLMLVSNALVKLGHVLLLRAHLLLLHHNRLRQCFGLPSNPLHLLMKLLPK